MYLLLVAVLNVIILIFLSRQARILSIGSCLQVSASESPNLTSIMASVWISHNPLMRYLYILSNMPHSTPYLLLLFSVALADEGFSVYAVRGKGLLIKVQVIVTHFVVTCNDEASVDAAKSVTYREACYAAVTFF